MMLTLAEKKAETIHFLHTKEIKDADYGLILGSGLGDLVEDIQNKIEIPYEAIPHFPTTTVIGHSGKLVSGILSEKKF
nr:hypothetical protein [Listeria ivanovii]